MKNVNGPPVIGDDFYGRDKELVYVWGEIKNGNNLILPSPRRVGKTSFAFKLLDIAKAEGWEVIALNLEKHNEFEFIEALMAKLIALSASKALIEKGKKFLSSLKRIKPTVTYEGTTMTYEIEDTIVNPYKDIEEIINHEKPTLIFLDELTILLNLILKSENGKARVSSFMHWLRDVRIYAGSRVRWILCSSVGIENFAHSQGLSETLNDISSYKLRPFNKDTSIAMLTKLAHGAHLKLGEDIPIAVVGKLGYCIPYFLQIVFQKIRNLNEVDEIPLNVEIVALAYTTIVKENHFNTWIERIEKQYGEDVPHVFALLKQLCQTEMKRNKLYDVLMNRNLDSDVAESKLARLISMMENDGYIIEEEGVYMFRSPLIRDFWKNRFVK